MSSPYNSHGYRDLREYAVDAYTHLALVDDDGGEVTRIDVTSDDRVQEMPDPSTNPIRYVVEVAGTDSDINNPVTVVETRLYKSASHSTSVGSDSMKPAEIEATGDTLTVSHEQQLPPEE